MQLETWQGSEITGEVNTIEKHVGKVYDKKTANDENKSTARWKYVNKCRHLQFEVEYNEFLLNKKKLRKVEQPSNLNLER